MPSLDLYLHDRRVGVVTPDARKPSRVRLAIDPDYDPDAGVLLSEAFTTLAGARPSVEAVTNFLGGYVPEGNHRVQMAAKRRIDKDDLFALLDEFGGSIAGAVNLRRPGETSTGNPSYQLLDDRELEAILKQASPTATRGSRTTAARRCPGTSRKFSWPRPAASGATRTGVPIPHGS
jgi:serine/threonine-protein kinase HipA